MRPRFHMWLKSESYLNHANNEIFDNIRVLECPAKLVRRLIRRLSGDSIGVPFLSSLYRLPTVATDPTEHSLSILLATHDVSYCTNYIHNIQGVI